MASACVKSWPYLLATKCVATCPRGSASVWVRMGPRDVGRVPRQCRASAPTGSICASVFESVQAVACAGAVSVNALASARDDLQKITKK